MRRIHIIRQAGMFLLTVFAVSACSARVHARQVGQDSFAQGDFAAAEESWLAALAENPQDPAALAGLARLCVFQNRFSDARRYIKAWEELPPPAQAAGESNIDKSDIVKLQAEIAYRQDDFPRAAELFEAAGRQALAEKLRSFGDKTPYEILPGPDGAVADKFTIRFLQTDPLPILQARINGGEEVLFVLDTGGGELILDPDVAAQFHARVFGEEEATFAGGQTAQVRQAAIDSLQFGDLHVRNVPVRLLPTKKFAAVAGGKPVAGVLGTVFLYHFLATIDYDQGELILRTPGSTSARTWRASLEQDAETSTLHRVPMWLAGDHLILARGAVNSAEECLMFIDTGLAGAGFTCPASTIEQAGIQLSGNTAQGVGGAGAVSIQPFQVGQLRLGSARREKLLGIYGAFPPSLENGLGFRIGGLVSHTFFRPYAVTFDFQQMEIVLHSME